MNRTIKIALVIFFEILIVSALNAAEIKAPYLKNFSVEKIITTDKDITVLGKINNKNAQIVKEIGNTDTYEVKGDDLQLEDIIPQTKGIKFLEEFKLDNIIHSEKSLTVEGKINNKKTEVIKDLTKDKTFEVTSSDLQLGDIFPQTKSIKFLEIFKFDSVIHTENTLTVTGKINNKKAQVLKDLTKENTYEITGEGLQLQNIIPGI